MLKKFFYSLLFLLPVLSLAIPVAQTPQVTWAQGSTRIIIAIDDMNKNVRLSKLMSQKNTVFFDVYGINAKRARMIAYPQNTFATKVVVSQFSSDSVPIVRVVLFHQGGLKKARYLLTPELNSNGILIDYNDPRLPSGEIPIPASVTTKNETPVPPPTPKPVKEKPVIKKEEPKPVTPTVDTTTPAPKPTPVPEPDVLKPMVLEPKKPEVKKEEPKPLKISKEGVSAPPIQRRVTAKFTDADLYSVVRALSSQAGLNIYSGLKLEGKVTREIKDEPVGEILRVILEENKYKMDIINPESIKITEISKKPDPIAASTKPEIKVFTLSLKEFDMLRARMNVLLNERVREGQTKPEVNAATVTFVVTATPDTLNALDELIKTQKETNP